MARRFYQLPSLTGLNAFDACARHGSFTAASSELGVTLGAVSRQIRVLEQELNCQLFERQQRGVELSAEGRDLHSAVSDGFQRIGRVSQQLKARDDPADITLAATTAFATLWLMPRLGDFWQQHSDIALNHVISDNPRDPSFLNADIRVRYGDGEWRDEETLLLFDDVIYPVCGRDFIRRHQLLGASSIDTPELVSLPLLKLDGPDPSWTGWETWFAEFDLPMPQTPMRRFNNFVVALQAAEENQGVVMGWHCMVAPLVADGRLVRLGQQQMQAPGSFYLSWDAHRDLKPEAALFRDWLQAICQA